jgi:hypothetical protein
MARIVITLEDTTHDKVRVVSNPTFQEIAQMVNSGHKTTPAHDYAVGMLNTALQFSKQAAKDRPKLIIPNLVK